MRTQDETQAFRDVSYKLHSSKPYIDNWSNLLICLFHISFSIYIVKKDSFIYLSLIYFLSKFSSESKKVQENMDIYSRLE